MSEAHVCPWWIGYLMAHPLRKLIQNPFKLLGKYITKGSRVLEIGPGMGYFTLPAAEMAGPQGKVITVEIQQRMLDTLVKRAAKKKLLGRIDARLCNSESFCIDDLTNSIDFCLLLYVFHEIPNMIGLADDLAKAMKKGGKVLFSEPPGHVSITEFEQSISIFTNAGFQITSRPDIKYALSAVFEKL